jgi:uncharacterized protein YlxW (UPF0749 family)
LEEKTELEVLKLKLEIEQLKNRWWTKPSYLALLLPLVIAILSFISAQSTGYFDTYRDELNKEKQELKSEIKVLEIKKNDLETHVTKIKNAHESFRRSVTNIVESRSISGPAGTDQQQRAFLKYRATYQYLIDTINQDELEE